MSKTSKLGSMAMDRLMGLAMQPDQKELGNRQTAEPLPEKHVAKISVPVSPAESRPKLPSLKKDKVKVHFKVLPETKRTIKIAMIEMELASMGLFIEAILLEAGYHNKTGRVAGAPKKRSTGRQRISLQVHLERETRTNLKRSIANGDPRGATYGEILESVLTELGYTE